MATNIDLLRQFSDLPAWKQQQLLMDAANFPSAGGISNLTNTPASHVPRSMSAYSMPIATHLPAADPMDRTHSAPASASASTAMGRSTSTLSFSADSSMGARNMAQRSFSTLPASQSQDDDEPACYALYSQTASIRKRPSLQPINEMSTFGTAGFVEYDDPADYINQCIESSGSAYPPSSTIQQLTPDMQWCPSLDGSVSPSVSSVGMMTPATISSSSMSRQASHNPQFLQDPMSMLRVQSDSSFQYPILSEDGFSFASDVEASNISACADTSLFPSTFTGYSSSEAVFPYSAQVSPSTNTLGVSPQQQLDLAEDMRRSASSSSESDASYASARSDSSRHSRREREVNAHASRKIAPKAIHSNNQTLSASFNVQMKRMVSADGSSKDVAPITKAPYIRPQHPKILCPHCASRPEGFRGTHELERHVARAHASVRKGYICIDYSEDKKFLANCKHCRKGKVYGAYYNAAAHLRRAHFHPRKRGRKGKHDEKRGGIGGGDDPPMETLKTHWIKEVEVGDKVKVERVKQPRAPAPTPAPVATFPNNNNNTTTDAACDEQESFDYVSYPPAPPAPMTDMSNMHDFNNQYMDQGVYMSSNVVSDGSSYDQYYGQQPMSSSTNNDINNFQFEACQFETC